MNRIILLCAFLLAFKVHAAEPNGVRYDHLTAGTTSYDVAELDLKYVDLKLYWKNPSGVNFESLGAVRSFLKAEGKTFLMATNSGIYAEDYTPLGLHIERGKVLQPLNRSCASSGNFYKCPNGVFLLTDKGARVLYSTEFPKFKGVVLEATQSGPILLRSGNVHPKFKKDSANLKLRSGVGVNRDGHVVFAISDGAVDFWDFAMFFKDTLHCQDALSLDGTISVLMAGDKAAGQFKPFAGIWAATRRD